MPTQVAVHVMTGNFSAPSYPACLQLFTFQPRHGPGSPEQGGQYVADESHTLPPAFAKPAADKPATEPLEKNLNVLPF